MFENRDRLSLIIEALEGGKRASEYAEETGVSRQRIHQILKKNKVRYQRYKDRRIRKRIYGRCKWCHRLFKKKVDGTGWKFCSKECAEKYKKVYRAISQRSLYQTPKYKFYKKEKQKEQYDERLKNVVRVCPTCRYEFHPRKVRPNLKYCSRHCFLIRGKFLDKS